MTDENQLAPIPPRQDAVLEMIDRAARDPSVNVDKMKELLAMRREMMAIEAERVFDEAMNEAQADMLPVVANLNNDQTKSKYASYEAFDDAIRPIYTKHGFSVRFGTGACDRPDHIRIICKVGHIGGHREIEHIDMPADGKGPKGTDVMTKTHAAMSAVTYGRRALLGMVFNIAVTRDDDGNAAAARPLEKTIDAEQYQHMVKLMDEANADEAKILNHLKVTDLETLTQKQYRWVIQTCNQLIKDRKK